jgi:geranylgeranyl pyrophosphate synthase
VGVVVVTMQKTQGLLVGFTVDQQAGGESKMFTKIMDYFQNHDTFFNWKDMNRLITKIINDKPKHILIPNLIAKAYGCDDERIIAAGACLALAFSSIIILDDLLDNDQRFSQDGTNPADLANISAALVSLAYRILPAFLNSGDDIYKGIVILSEMLEKVAYGQSMDARNPCSEAEYWKVTQLKSSAFFSGAFALGGLAVGVGLPGLEKLQELGRQYGVLIQIHDDLRDSLEIPPNPDWHNGRHPLPILFAETVEHPLQSRFIDIRGSVDDPHILAEAQEILIRCGAISYGMHQIRVHYQESMKLMELLRIDDASHIKMAFDELLHPVDQLIEKLLEKNRLLECDD